MKLMNDAVRSMMTLDCNLQDRPCILTEHRRTDHSDDNLFSLHRSILSDWVYYWSDSLAPGQSLTVLDSEAPDTHMTPNVRLPYSQIQYWACQPLSIFLMTYMHPDDRVPVCKDGKLWTMARKSAQTIRTGYSLSFGRSTAFLQIFHHNSKGRSVT